MPRESSKQRIQRCKNVVDQNPESPSAHFNLGEAYRKSGRMDSAEASFVRATELDPAMAKAWVNLGGVRLLKWDFEASVQATAKAIELDPDLLEAHFGMGQAMLYLKRPDDVVRCFTRVVEIDPQHGAGHYFLATGHLAARNVRAARESLSTSMSLGHQPRPEFLRELNKAEKEMMASSIEAEDSEKNSSHE